MSESMEQPAADGSKVPHDYGTIQPTAPSLRSARRVPLISLVSHFVRRDEQRRQMRGDWVIETTGIVLRRAAKLRSCKAL